MHLRMTEHDREHTNISLGDPVSSSTPPVDPVTQEQPGTASPQQTRKQSSLVREIIETALLALIIFVAVRSVVLNFKVDGLSMMPSFENGEMLLVNRNSYRSIDTWDFIDWLPFVDEHNDAEPFVTFGEPKRGDVIVFTPPEPGQDKPYIKRVIGLPGDTVEVHDDGVYVNGTQIEEPYLEGDTTSCRTGTSPFCGSVTVPQGSVYVLGDNRSNSEDSRFFGPVPENRIIGKAWITYWPTEVIGVVPHYDYPRLPESNNP
jgi:signal peptidase I